MLTCCFPCAIVYADNLEKCLALSRSFRRSQLSGRETASEGKAKLLTVPLSGRNGRFFLAVRSLWLLPIIALLKLNDDLLERRKPLRVKEEKNGKARGGNEVV